MANEHETMMIQRASTHPWPVVIFGLAALLAAGCAGWPGTRGRTYRPRYADAFSMRYGLFIHWVCGGPGRSAGLVQSDGRRIRDLNEYADSIDVEKVADECRELGFEYVILTDFHGLGTTLHPCAALDKWRGKGYAARRDVIGEFIAALKRRGIGFILFTHPLDGHDYPKEQQEKLGWNDPAGNYRKWNDFVNDVYAELAERYGKDIMGFGFDSCFGLSAGKEFHRKLDLQRLRRTIHARAPHLQLYALAGPNDTCEFGHKELWRPSWHDPWKSRKDDDYDVETWPAYRRVVSVVLPYHWATVGPPEKGITHLNAEQVFRYTVLQAAAATEGPGAAWAASPYNDGTWENNVREVFAAVAAYMKPVRRSLTRVYPSTSYPTPEGAKLAELPRGIVATKATDDTVEYIHVLNPPAGRTLFLPEPRDGKRFTGARLLKNGRPVALEHHAAGITLTLNEPDDWNRLDTVVALTVDPATIPRKNLARHKQVLASSTIDNDPGRWPPASDYGRIRLTDGIRTVQPAPEKWLTGNKGWSSKPTAGNRPQWAGVDLGEFAVVQEVRLYPRDDAGHEGEGFPVDLEVQLSDDGRNWRTVAAKQDLPRRRDVLIIRFQPAVARYVRVVGNRLRPGGNKSFSMQIVELEVYAK